MDEILDESLYVTVENKYSIRSFKYFIGAVFCLAILFGITYATTGVGPKGYLETIFLIILLLFFIASILGFRNAFLSVLKKEVWGSKKFIGLLGNFLFFGIFVSLIVASILDLKSFLG